MPRKRGSSSLDGSYSTGSRPTGGKRLKQAWRIDLLGILTARRNGQEIARFRTLKTAALLGYLAYDLRTHSREELITLLWPEADGQNGRNSLSVALSSLRTQLEPTGVEFGSVLLADRHYVSLNSSSVSTDLAEFQALATSLDVPILSRKDEIMALQRVVGLYRGRLLEGLYEDWILGEGLLLEGRFLSLLDRLNNLLFLEGDYPAMQRCAERGVALAPWRELGHRDLMRALAGRGQNESALQHFRHWRESPDAEAVSPAMLTLIEEIEHGLARGTQTSSTEESALVTAPAQFVTENETAPPMPQAVSGSSTNNSLPLRRTRFFGRRVQLRRLVEQLAPGEEGPSSQRLITLTGMGGSGKTRLAVEVASQLFDRYKGKLWFIALAGFLSPDLLDIALRDALQITPDPQAAPLDQISEFLSGCRAMLILDNFETLLPLGAAWIAMLQKRLPDLTCLVTSRQKLEVEGEKEMVVRPLPVPNKSQPLHVENLFRFSGIQLFVDRAQIARPDFGLTRRNAGAVMELCLALEGVPLALELAAARSSALSPSQMLEQWELRAELLQSSRRDLPSRHRSMHAAIEASYDLLPAEMQLFFKRQWVFRGGWTPEAAAQVCEEPRALHFATQLRGCSLLFQQDRAETVRFSCLELLRDFAGKQLSPEEREEIQLRHANYYLSLVTSSFSSHPHPVQNKRIARFHADLENYRAALEWCHANQPELALQLAVALWPWWETASNLQEGRTQLERAIRAVPHAPAPLRARAVLGIGTLAYHQDFDLAQPFLEEALALYRELGDDLGVAASLCPLSKLLMNRHDPRARPYAEEALRLARQLGDLALEAEASFCLGVIALGSGELDDAKLAIQLCAAFNRRDGDRFRLIHTLDVLGMALWALGEYEESGKAFEEANGLARELKCHFMVSHTLWGISTIARSQGDIPRALTTAHESLMLVQKWHFTWFVPYTIANLAHAKIENGEIETAVILLGATEAQHEALKTPLMPLFFKVYENYVAQLKSDLKPEVFESLWQRGRSFSSEEAVDFGLSQRDLAPTSSHLI